MLFQQSALLTHASSTRFVISSPSAYMSSKMLRYSLILLPSSSPSLVRRVNGPIIYSGSLYLPLTSWVCQHAFKLSTTSSVPTVPACRAPSLHVFLLFLFSPNRHPPPRLLGRSICPRLPLLPPENNFRLLHQSDLIIAVRHQPRLYPSSSPHQPCRVALPSNAAILHGEIARCPLSDSMAGYACPALRLSSVSISPCASVH